MIRLIKAVTVIILTILVVSVTYGAQYEQLSDIKASVKNFAQKKVSLAAGERVDVQLGYLDSRLKLAKCGIPLEIFLPNSNGNKPSSIIGVRCNGIRPWKIYVPVKLKIYKKVVIAEHTLPRGSRISASDLKIAEQNIAGLNRGFFTSKETIIGKILTRSIRTGLPITQGDLTQPLLIKRGQAVTITSKNMILSVTTKGIALRSGRQGEMIPVKNTKSKRIVDATIISSNLVQVALP